MTRKEKLAQEISNLILDAQTCNPGGTRIDIKALGEICGVTFTDAEIDKILEE